MSNPLADIQKELDVVRKTLLDVYYEGMEIASWGGKNSKGQVSDEMKRRYLKLVFEARPTSAQLVHSCNMNRARTAIMASANGTGKSFWSYEELHAHITTFRPMFTDLEGVLDHIMRKEAEFLNFELTETEFRFWSKTNKSYKANVPWAELAELWHTQVVPKFDDLKQAVWINEVRDEDGYIDEEKSTPETEYLRIREARIMARDLQHVGKKTVEPLIRLWCEPWITRSVRNPQGIYTTWEFEFNGEHSAMDVVSAINPDPNILEGWEGQWFHMEEPIPRDPYIRTIRGSRSVWGFKCSGALTPISDPWMFHDLKRKADGVKIAWLEADWTTNKSNLNPDYYDNLKSQLTKDEIEARMYGRYSFLLGLVFKEFNRDIHMMKQEVWYPPPEWQRYRAIDVASMRKPQAVSYVAVSPAGKYYIYHEIWEFMTNSDMAKALKDYEEYERSMGVPDIPMLETDPEYAYNTIYYTSWIDPLSSTVDPQTGVSTMEQLENMGIQMLLPGSKDVTTRTRIMKQLLEDERLFVAQHCYETIRNFESYSLKPDRPDVSDTALNKPRDKDNDMMENIGRILIVQPRHVDPKHRDEPDSWRKMLGSMEDVAA